MFHFLLPLFLCLASSIFSAAPSKSILAATEGEPSAVVAGCVNAITGDYIVSESDIVVAGIEPIHLPRIYISTAEENRFGGWLLYHSLIAKYKVLINLFEVAERSGALLGYNPIFPLNRDEKKMRKEGKLIPCRLSLGSLYGLTNCAHEKIGAKNNLKNNYAELNLDHELFYIYGSDGSKRCYKLIPNQKRKAEVKYHLLQWENLPNGNVISYEYDSDHRINMIRTTDATLSKTYASARIHYLGNVWDCKDFNVETSDGRILQYRHKREGTEKENYIFYLESVVSSCSNDECISYHNKTDRRGPVVGKRCFPDGRSVQINYYDSQPDAPYCNRVESISSPVGSTDQLVTTHRFTYHLSEHATRGITTEVHDAYGNKTTYTANAQMQLQRIDYHQKIDHGQKLLKSECFVWGKQDSGDKNNLLCKLLINANGLPVFARRFHYDAKGNITTEVVYGNLSGTSSPIQLNEDGLPKNNHSECYSKHYTYNERNLVVKETEDSGRTTLFTYLPNSEYLSSKLIFDHNTIKIRHFYDYNQDNILICEITDDGSSEHKDVLTGVTERRMRRYTLRTKESFGESFIGFPSVIEEKYLDKATGLEKLLKKTVLTYSKHGQITQKDIYDAENNKRYSLFTEYDAKGRISAETNPLGQRATSSYDANGNKIKIEDFSGKRVTSFSYDYSNRLTHVQQRGADGIEQTTQNSYDHLHHKIASIDAYGNQTSYVHDALGHPVTTILPAICGHNEQPISPKIERTFDALDQETSLTNAIGETTKTIYNARNAPLAISYPDGTSAHFHYTLDGQLKESIDQEGTLTRHTYDFLGRETHTQIVSKSGELLAEQSYTYNAFHLQSKKDAAGNLTTYTYDDAGRKIAEEINGKERVEFLYDSLGRICATRVGSGADTKINRTILDLLDRPIEERTEDESGRILSRISYTYDAFGNKSSISRAINGQESCDNFVYDSIGRPIKQIDALGHTTHISYDEKHRNPLGQFVLKKTHTDPMGLQTTDIHDPLGRVVSTEKVSPYGEVLALETYAYDLMGKLIKQQSHIYATRSASGRHSERHVTTLWEYGTLGRLLTLTEAAGTPEQKTTRYTYTLRGERAKTIKPDGVILKNSYDPLGRLIHLESSDHSVRYTYRYDALGQLLESTDLNTGLTTSRSYDDRGRVLSEKLANHHLLKNSYDALGRRTRLTLPDHSSIDYTYDALFLKQVDRHSKKGERLYTHRYTAYDLSGHLLEEELPFNLGTVSYRVDALGRTHAFTSPALQQNIEAYDACGNIEKMSHRHLNTPSQAHSETTYTYDALYQLTEEKGSFSQTFTYDSHNNRLSKNDIPYEINALNQILAVHHARYIYDANGNPICKKTDQGEIHYTYDALDRLLEVHHPKHMKSSYTYDSFHRRQSRHFCMWHRGEWEEWEHHFYLYDGQNEIGATDAHGQMVQLRILGSTPHAEIGAAIALELLGKTYVPIHDLQGNVAALISATTKQVKEYTLYSAFGEHAIFDANGDHIARSQAANFWRFNSKRFDEETQLIYYGRRFYDPELGRWLTPDPQGFTDGPNLYAFVHNNPLTHFDLYGLETENAGFLRRNLDAGLDFLRSATHFIGRSINHLFHHFVPIPYVRSYGKALGDYLAGKEVNHEHGSERIIVGGQNRPPDETIILSINGQLTKRKEAIKQAQYLSDTHGGHAVEVVYNSSRGFILDCFESVVQKLGFTTRAEKLAHRAVRSALERAKDMENPLLIINGWSQGGIIAERVTEHLSPQDKSMISVRTFGSASLFTGRGLKSVRHYVHAADIVPLLSINYYKNIFSSDSNIHFIKGKTTIPGWGHAFSTYHEAIENAGRYAINTQ